MAREIRCVLVIGKDARTDAITAACAVSPRRPELHAFAEMLIPGLVEKCGEPNVHLGSLTSEEDLRKVLDKVKPDLVIVGPEEPLEAGFVDILDSLDILAFGPIKELAQIESSKSWARQLVDKYAIPGNPDYRVFDSDAGLRTYMEDLGAFVVKPDGLTAGKGVRVFGEHLHSIDEALEYSLAVLSDHARVQIEERLEGEEFSLQTITDGTTCIHLPLVQDHKRAYEGDEGPNTGGMGSYSCADFSLPFLSEEDAAQARAINEQVVEALLEETGEPYRGVLYGGFIATRDGVRLIEYNARFGDPEALNVLPLLEADFVQLCAAVATGTLSEVPYSFRRQATVCKYLVPVAYPDPTPEPPKLEIPPETLRSDDVKLFWAASKLVDGTVQISSSRTAAFVGIGDTLAEAEAAAERAALSVDRTVVRHRKDIGRQEMVEARIRHMRELRSPVGASAAHR